MVEIVLSSKKGTHEFTIDDPIASAILVCIEDFKKDFYRAGMNKSLLIPDYLKILLLKVDRVTTHHGSIINENANQLIFQKFIYQIEQDIFKTRKVAHYSKCLGVSLRKLSQICNEFRGQSAKNVLDERLISESKYLLIHTAHSVKYISLFLGFSDQYQFSKYFKKHLRISPTRYRIVNSVAKN